MSTSYDELLSGTWEDIPDAVLLPNGGWLLKGTTVALVKPREEGKAMKVLFTYKAKEAVAVAEDLIDELGDYDITINDLTFTIFLESAADWSKVKKHLALHGIEMKGSILNEDGKLAFAKNFRNSEVVAQVGSRSYDNAEGETVWNNTLSKFQAVE